MKLIFVNIFLSAVYLGSGVYHVLQPEVSPVRVSLFFAISLVSVLMVFCLCIEKAAEKISARKG